MTKPALLIAIMILAIALPAEAEQPDAGQACRDQLGLVTALAAEYDTTRDAAVRDKVVYKRAFENERVRRLALEKQVADLKAELEKIQPKPDPKVDEKPKE